MAQELKKQELAKSSLSLTNKEIEMNLNETITEKAHEAKAIVAELPELAASWKTKAEALVQEKPVVCLAGAFAIGFLIAKVARHA